MFKALSILAALLSKSSMFKLPSTSNTLESKRVLLVLLLAFNWLGAIFKYWSNCFLALLESIFLVTCSKINFTWKASVFWFCNFLGTSTLYLLASLKPSLIMLLGFKP